MPGQALEPPTLHLCIAVVLVAIALMSCSNEVVGRGAPTTLEAPTTPTESAPSTGAQTKPVVDVHVSRVRTYYKVTGRTAAQLQASLNEQVLNHGGVPANAETTWHVTWPYTYGRIDGDCTLLGADVSVDVAIVLPRWSGKDEAGSLRKDWIDYISALNVHESRHADIAFGSGRDLARKLEQLPTYASCRKLKRRIDKAGVQALHRLKLRQDAYDERTRHGVSQGAVFP